MATEDVRSMLEDCVNKLNINTSHTENFLDLQDDVAADFTSLAKVLYDFHKGQEPADCKGSPLEQLVVEDFDEEQIWQELELQNTAVLRHFETVVNDIISDDALTILEEKEEENDNIDEEMGEDMGEDDEEEEEEEEPHRKPKKRSEDGEGDFTDEDSDLDFDVDALEKREKQRRQAVGKASKAAGVPSEVDDKFFKLSEMESFLDDMDKKEEKEVKEGVEDVDYFQDLPSDDDDDDDLDLDEDVSAKKQKRNKAVKSSRNLKYKDFFDTVGSEAGKADHQSEDEDDSMDGMQEDPEEEDDEEEDDEDEDKEMGEKRVTFNLSGEKELSGEEESEGEDIEDILGGKGPNSEKSAYKSSFEKRQEKMTEKIQELEKSALSDKPWQLSGEVTAQTRPENSMLEEDVQFDQQSRLAPTVTEETTLQLEDIIKQRIKDQVFDDVVRKNKPKEDAFEYKKRLTLDHEKSKLSLAQVYEQEYLKMTQEKTEEVEKPAHVEIQKLMDTLFLKLDALSNFHFTPKPPVPEVKVVSNLPSIAMEEVAPVSASDATLLAPEEVKEKSKAGDVLGDTEKTSTDKKRERRKKKTVKRVKIKEKERRQKEKEATRVGENKKPTKAEVAQNLQKITKGGKAKILKDEGKDKALRSSQAFFSQLQDQVKSQVKSIKDQALKKKKKHKEVSVGKLKL